MVTIVGPKLDQVGVDEVGVALAVGAAEVGDVGAPEVGEGNGAKVGEFDITGATVVDANKSIDTRANKIRE